MHIFLARNNVQAGPYTLDELNNMLASGQVAMTDLLWHEGMANWQTVASVTGGQPSYRPTFVVNDTNLSTVEASQDEAYIINNTPAQDPEPEPDTKEQAPDVWERYKANNPHRPNQQTQRPQSVNLTKTPVRNTRPKDISQANKSLILASTNSRVLASMIDFVLLVLASMPLFLALMHSPVFAQLLKWAEAGQVLLNTNQKMQLLAAVPTHIIWLTHILVWGLLITQLILLIKRGQTIGKAIMGIRVLDKQTNAIPSFFNLIVMRSWLTLVVYSLSVIGIIALAIDFIVMLSDKNRQSLHDKIAKTYVVRADDTQTTPLKIKPNKA